MFPFLTFVSLDLPLPSTFNFALTFKAPLLKSTTRRSREGRGEYPLGMVCLYIRFLIVYLQMYFKSTCIRGCKITLVALFDFSPLCVFKSFLKLAS